VVWARAVVCANVRVGLLRRARASCRSNERRWFARPTGLTTQRSETVRSGRSLDGFRDGLRTARALPSLGLARRRQVKPQGTISHACLRLGSRCDRAPVSPTFPRRRNPSSRDAWISRGNSFTEAERLLMRGTSARSNRNLSLALATTERATRSAVSSEERRISMRLRIAVVVFAALGGVVLTSTAASAMPNGIPNVNEIVGQASNVEQARSVCGPRGCVRRLGPRFVGRPGWHARRSFAWSRPAWGPRPGWRSAYAWGGGPVWGPSAGWGASPGWGLSVGFGPRPGWGWNNGWW